MDSLEGYEGSGSGQRAACDPAILNVAISHEVKSETGKRT